MNLPFTAWYAVIGALLIIAVVTRTFARRLSLNTTMFYLGVGYTMGPSGLGWITLDPVEGSWFTERLTEIAVIISLFSAGMKLGLPLGDALWRLPLRLAFVSMTATVGLITTIGVALMDLPLGAAVLLGGILAPTDPVLASDVQLVHHDDRDRMRLGLTGEAGLNDGTAFPFVLLGLGLLGLHDLGAWGWHWIAVDVVWATSAGLGIGAALGWSVGHLVLYLRANHKEAVGLDEFLALGLIALSYGSAVLAQAYGFLAVFAAGWALRRVERLHPGDAPPDLPTAHAAQLADLATRPETAPAYLAGAVLRFNEQTEHLGEFLVVLFVGAMLSLADFTVRNAIFVLLLFLAVRPLAVWPLLIPTATTPPQRLLISWFGIRGLGTVYYLAYAVQQGLPLDLAGQLVTVTLATVGASVIVHGASAPALLRLYAARRR